MINMDSTENAQNIAVIRERLNSMDERIIELAGNYNALSKSYFVLNECHHKLEIGFAEMRAELRTVKAIIIWVISPTAVIAFLIQVSKLCGVI